MLSLNKQGHPVASFLVSQEDGLYLKSINPQLHLVSEPLSI